MSDDQVQQLERLEALHARGALTDEEFGAAKARVLAVPEATSGIGDESPPAERPPAAPVVFPPPREKPVHESPSASLGPPVTAPSGDLLWAPGEPGNSGGGAAPAGIAPPASPPPAERYPVRYEVAYPEHLSRWKTLLRLPLLVPVWIFMDLVQYALWALLAIGWTTVFFRKKYPSWAFAGASGAIGFSARTFAYGLLQTDKFPSFDRESSPVLLEFDPPPSGHLSRWRVFFWKLALLVPHFVVLIALQLALFVVTVLAWFGIVFSGHYPRGLFPFATGVMRWHYRVYSYFASFNDRYPPYSLSSEAGPAGKAATVWSGIGGIALAGGLTALIITAAVIGSRPDTVEVDYAALVAGRDSRVVAYSAAGGEVTLTLVRATDPGNDLARIITPAANERVVVFEWSISNASSGSRHIAGDAAWLGADDGGARKHFDAEIITVQDRAAPEDIGSRKRVAVRAVFVIPANATPVELHFKAGFTGLGGVKYVLR